MDKFKIRASKCSEIMTNDRSGKEMGETAKSYCNDWLISQLYGKKKEINSKYLERGITSEQDGIDFIADYYNYGILLKNETQFENDYITGTPDVILKDKIIDVKCSWDCFTFPLLADNYPKTYYWQAQCYMILTGIKYYELIYVLLDLPINLIEHEAWNYARANGYDSPDDYIFDLIKEKNTYKNIPDFFKIKKFDIEYNQEAKELIEKRVNDCRNYIDNLIMKNNLIYI